MLGWLGAAGGKALGGIRFTLINVFPGALLLLTILAAFRSGLYGRGRIDLTRVIPNSVTVGEVAVVVLAALLLGVLSQPFQVSLVRVLEGYGWFGRVPNLLIDMAVERHVRRIRLADYVAQQTSQPPPANMSLAASVRWDREARRTTRLTARASDRLDLYPDEDRVMPTLLGNVLRRTEDDAGGRYNLPTMAAYPRMYPYVSSRLEAAIRQQLDLIDTTCALCVSMLLAAAATVPVVTRLDAWSLLPIAPLLLALLSYHGAVRAAAWHGVLLCAAFDLHRFDMTAAMHLPLPGSPAAEVRFNARLGRFLRGELSLVEAMRHTGYRHAGRPSLPSESNGSADA